MTKSSGVLFRHQKRKKRDLHRGTSWPQLKGKKKGLRLPSISIAGRGKRKEPQEPKKDATKTISNLS